MRKLCLISAICCLILSGCIPDRTDPPNQPQPAGTEAMASQEITVLPEPAAGDVRYRFCDEAVRTEVEIYFGKNADELSEEDIRILSEFDYLVVNRPIASLKDIEQLFPGIRYLKIDYTGSLSKEDAAVLKNLTSLKALTMCSGFNSDRSFAENLSYLELSCPEEEYTKESNNLSAYSVLGKEVIDKNITGIPLKFIRLSTEDGCYELVATDQVEGEIFFEQERKVFISGSDGKEMVCHAVLDATNGVGGYAKNRIQLIDVNFDGNRDILIDNGHFGNQGLVTYTCFLNQNGSYERCGSFSDIANPAVDSGNKMILSTWRNWAASHSWAMYRYEENEYILTDCLTESAVTPSPEEAESATEDIWEYIIEQRINGEILEKERFTTKDQEQIHALFYDAQSDWALLSDKWSALYNNGKMADFSIYGSNDINGTILEIINQE